MYYKKAKLTIYGLFVFFTLSAQPSVKLADAIERNDTTEVNYWIENADIDQRFVDKEGNNHLLLAAGEGHPEIVEILLKAGWDVNYQNKEGTTALHEAARKDRLEVVKFLINCGANLNAMDQSGNTPLFYAAGTRDLELVKLLINKGANVNASVEEKHTKGVVLLDKEQGAYVRDARDIGDSSPMRVSVSLPICQAIFCGDDKTASYLLDAGTSVNMLKRDPFKFCDAVGNGLTLTVKKLINAGVDLNFTCGSTTPLAEAAKIRNLELISLLLENGANPNYLDPKYATFEPISAAIPFLSSYEKNELSKELKDTITKVVKLLIDHKGKFSFNDFYRAIEIELEDVALLMLEHGLDISEKNNAANYSSNFNYAAFAIKNNCFKLAETIIKKSSVKQIDYSDSGSATALMWAIYKNQVTLAKVLIEKGANPNKKGILWVENDPAHTLYYETPLCIASGMGNLGLVKLLVASGAKINNNNKIDNEKFDGWSPIFCSAQSGHTTVSKYLITQKAVVTEKDRAGRSMLHFAAFGGDTALINYLIRLGLPVNATDSDGNTPMHFAAGNNKVQATVSLLKKGADINKINKQGFPAWAYCFSAGSIEMIDSLEKIRKIGGVVTKEGLSPLMVACKYKNTLVAQYLLNKAANSKLDKNTRDSILLSAVKNKDTTILKIILQDTSGINLPYDHNKMLMQYAYESYDSSTMALLLLHGANPSVSMNDEHKTPVVTEALFGYMKNIVRLLIKSNADLCAKDLKGNSFLNYLFARYYDPDLCNLAAENMQVNDLRKISYGDLITLLRLCRKPIAVSLINKLILPDSSLRNDALHIAASYGSYEPVIKLAKITRNINAVDDDGNTPFHIACENGYLNIAKVLFTSGSNINAKDSNGNTPLVLACKAGYLDLAKFLVANHADLNLENDEHSSPLFYAATNGYRKLTTFLCSAGADVNASNQYGFTILHAACRSGDAQIVRTLCNSGAITNLPDKLGKTPFFYAVKNNHLEVVRFLANSKVFQSRAEIIEMVNTSIQSKNTAITEVLATQFADSLKDSWNIFLERAIRANNPSVIEDLIAQGADGNLYFTYNGERINVIGYSIKYGYYDLAKSLIARRVNVTAKAVNDWPPLLLAVDKRNVPLARLLIESGCDVNMKVDLEYDGSYTALLMAVENDDLEMIKLLINKGAKPGFRNSQGVSVLEFAKSKKSNDIIKLLEDGSEN